MFQRSYRNSLLKEENTFFSCVHYKKECLNLIPLRKKGIFKYILISKYNQVSLALFEDRM